MRSEEQGFECTLHSGLCKCEENWKMFNHIVRMFRSQSKKHFRREVSIKLDNEVRTLPLLPSFSIAFMPTGKLISSFSD